MTPNSKWPQTQTMIQCFFAITGYKYSCILLTCSENWTCYLQMIVFLEAQRTNAYNRYAMCPAGQFRVNYWVLYYIARITTIMYDILPALIFRFFFFFFFSIKDEVPWRFPSSTNTWKRPEDISAETLWK